MPEPLKPRGAVDGRRVLVRGTASGTALPGEQPGRVFVLLDSGSSGNFPAEDVKPLEEP